MIRVIDGPFNDFSGVVKWTVKRVKVAVMIFGRSTPEGLHANREANGKDKKIMTYVKLQVLWRCKPSPPVGPALGQHGVSYGFCNAFNSKTNELEKNVPVPVVASVYEDRSFDFIIKTTPASILLKKQLDN